jgi:hypothetical protein
VFKKFCYTQKTIQYTIEMEDTEDLNIIKILIGIYIDIYIYIILL